tara:strand:+ start:3597 stop:3968 length:372 start_codon:yes stop_codon:yes gene_type:complete
MKSPKLTVPEMEKLWEDADEAGRAAVRTAHIQPMTVKSATSGETWFVPDGPCGFAWVKVVPGNSRFAKWMKDNGLGRKAWDGGVDYWISKYGQSMQKKAIYASAFANVLSAAGIRAYPESRMD